MRTKHQAETTNEPPLRPYPEETVFAETLVRNLTEVVAQPAWSDLAKKAVRTVILSDMTEFLQLATLLVDPQDQNGLSVFSAQDHQGTVSFHVKSSRKPA